jgi:hypothetical protein
VLPLASTASLYDNSLCRPASRPNYFSGLHSANKCHGLAPSRLLLINAIPPSLSFSYFVVRRRRVENYFAQYDILILPPQCKRELASEGTVNGTRTTAGPRGSWRVRIYFLLPHASQTAVAFVV